MILMRRGVNDRTLRWKILVIAFVTTLAGSTIGLGQEPDKEPEQNSAVIAATVGETRISVQSVSRFVDKLFAQKKLSEKAASVARQHALQHLVDRAIVRHYLISNQRWVDESVVRLEIEKLESDLARADVTLSTHLEKEKISREQFVYELEWRLSWEKYLDKVLTDKRLDQYFESKRREFDGTELKVAHLLIKDDSDNAHEQLIEIRNRLTADPNLWNELVAKHSQAASKDDGGVIGWIRIDGPMPKKFTTSAFALEQNGISKPLQTKFGTHLIKCLEVKPGKKGPRDAREKVAVSAKKFLFEKLARDNQDKLEITYGSR